MSSAAERRRSRRKAAQIDRETVRLVEPARGATLVERIDRAIERGEIGSRPHQRPSPARRTRHPLERLYDAEMIDDRQYAAGRTLRDDWERSEDAYGPRVTVDWSRVQAGGHFEPGLDAIEAKARYRWVTSPRRMDPVTWSALKAVCCEGLSPAVWAARRKVRRTGSVAVVAGALDLLAGLLDRYDRDPMAMGA